MRHRMFAAAALLLATVVGGCATYPARYHEYAYSYPTHPGYAYIYGPTYYAVYPGNYAYEYRLLYSPDYNSTFNTYPTAGNGSGS